MVVDGSNEAGLAWRGDMLIGIALYFLVAATLLTLLVSPTLRQTALGRTEQFWSASRKCLQGWLTAKHRTLNDNARVAVNSARSAAVSVTRRKWLATALITMAAGPPMLAFGLRRWNVLEFEEDTRDIDQQITALLRGERLVPPAPLPPPVFVTAEVTTVRPNLVGASRDWGLLDPEFKQRLLFAYRLMKQRHGYEMALLEGYRSPERQTILASGDGTAVTNAAAYQSFHQYGLAADNAFYRDGRLVISEQDLWAMRGYQLFGQVAAELGLVWGGQWRLRDYGHVELRRSNVLGRQ
jgi:peptidoglycan L-alanyl-D-glutamate endopeptidase CwlK